VLSKEEKEFDEQVQELAKVTVDSLNVDLLSRASGKRIDGKEVKGSIALLGAYLIEKDLRKEQLASILNAFRAVQSIRSPGSAHRKGQITWKPESNLAWMAFLIRGRRRNYSWKLYGHLKSYP
jgi:hypothetical protein